MSWLEDNAALIPIAKSCLFFIGGAPRSGTTWLQHLLDAHPDVCCKGEGHFLNHLIEPLGTLMARRRDALEEKNRAVFGETEGYPPPRAEDFEALAGTAILQALASQCDGVTYAAIGEKSPENVFYFANLKRMFPAAKFIGIAREPRDSVTSAWHFFAGARPGGTEEDAILDYVRRALPAIDKGARAMLAYRERYPDDCMIVTYEEMSRDPARIAAGLFRFLGVADLPEVVADCVARTGFAVMSGGRRRGAEQRGSFFRAGVVGDWRATLTPPAVEAVLNELGWMYPVFGWDV